MTDWNWNGARWWKVDFHTHTPVSTDYGKGPNQEELRKRTPRQWLLDFMCAGIDCVAITDHNSGAWIDELNRACKELGQEKPSGYREIHLFPGVELSVNGGIHLLALFDVSVSSSDIDTLLGAVGFSGVKGRSDSVTEKSFSQVVTEIYKAGGIAVPAHVDSNSGLFTVLGGTTLGQALDCQQIVAMEVLDPSRDKPQLYTERHRIWTEVLGSDSHHPTGSAGQHFPGSYFTWVKMANPSLEGLRLAMLDGALSVRRSGEQSTDPNVHASLAIEQFVAFKARYMGRSKAFQMKFNPWLNSVIGGRGTGKSTLVEFLRTVLQREDELPAALVGDFEKYRRAYTNRKDDGLLTNETMLVIVYRKDGVRYRIQWAQTGAQSPICVDDGVGGWKAEQGDVPQRFPVRIYSQKQIFELSKDPLALLRIVDEAPDVDRSSWDDRWRQEESRFSMLQAKARDVEAGLADEARLRGELEDNKRKLEAFEGTDHASVLKEYQRRHRQSGVVQSWEEAWSTIGERLRDSANDLVQDGLDESAFDADDERDQDLIARASIPIQRLDEVRQKLRDLAGGCDALFKEWGESRDNSPWKESLKTAVAAYESLCQKLRDEGAGDPSAYRELVNRRQEIEARLLDLQKRRNEMVTIRQDASSCLAGLLKLRQDITERRKTFIRSVLTGNPYVRITVVAYGARETVEPEIRRLIQRDSGGFEKDIGTTEDGDGLLSKLFDGNPAAPILEQRLAQLKETLRIIASAQPSAVELKDKRFGDYLAKLPPEALDRLDTWFPEDTLNVEYSTGGGGASFHSIQEGSPGQKTAALLAFLLSYGEEPIIFDQPEDDLDNQLIYSLIVNQLRAIKQRRQVIVITHNANIVVNGDAELVVALAARGGETQREAEGSLQQDAVRETICSIMEGGREAFEQRYRRIGKSGGETVTSRSAKG